MKAAADRQFLSRLEIETNVRVVYIAPAHLVDNAIFSVRRGIELIERAAGSIARVRIARGVVVFEKQARLPFGSEFLADNPVTGPGINRV